MGGFVIWVVFHLKPGARDQFVAAVKLNATASVRDEPGCQRFDVMVPVEGTADDVALYEIYDDRDAFHAHLETPHFKQFKQAIEPLSEGTTLQEYELRHIG